jgi:hypothetical protein
MLKMNDGYVGFVLFFLVCLEMFITKALKEIIRDVELYA